MSRMCICLMSFIVVLALVSAAPAAFDPDTDPDLLGHWTFDEGAGTMAADSSGNGNHGTLIGEPQWVEGLFGGAAAFDGVDDYIDTGSTENLPNWTISCWAICPLPPSNSAPTGPIHREQNYQISWHHSNEVFRGTAAISVGGTWYAASFGPMEGETWYHLAATYDGETFSSYKDGVLITANETPSGDASNDSNTLKFGRHALAAQYWGGTVDEIHVFTRALTADEIKVLSPPKPPKVKARKPDPADGTIGVTMPLLQWAKGDTALFHNVYIGSNPEVTEADLVASRQAFPMYYHAAGLQPGATYFWRVDEVEADETVHTGDIWSFIAQDVKAYYPTPVDGTNDASVSPTLNWLPGLNATEHQVYFGDSAEAVGQGAEGTDKGTVAETTFAPGDLEPLASYFWRVDETIAGGEIKAGEVWSFTTALSVDDMESYTDEEGTRIYETWIDGWTNGTGSTVGYVEAPFAEQTIVHGGAQSMPLDYNNVNSPFYSVAEREFSPIQDWTAGGTDTLIVNVQGRSINELAPLYISVEDSAGSGAMIVHPDLEIVAKTTWVEWQIPLSDFAGVNMARVEKMTIGIGDPANPTPDGVGLIYIDDIRLIRP